MLFPLSDDDRQLDGPAYVTLLLLAANVVIFALQLADPNLTYGWSVVPAEITTGTDLISPIRGIPQEPGPGGGTGAPFIYLTLLSSMFMHGGFGHIAGNMLYLWIFGDNVEHRFGPLPFLAFYLASGLAASFTQIALDPDGIIPNLGASGAISGVMGAYLVLFPRNKVNAIFFFRVVVVPAFLALGLWIALQFFNGYASIAATEETGGVAYGAHIGGFLAGAAFGGLARMMGTKERTNVLTTAIRRDPGNRVLW
ncbi:MAG: rhomboid family intramembrane serine protease [Rubricoccaceae bacterium]